MLSLIVKNRGFAIFLSSQGGSNIGDSIRQVVLPMILLTHTGSAMLVAAAALLQIVPYFMLQLPFGAYLDRWDRRRSMLFADLGRAALTLAVPATVMLGGPVIMVVFIIAAPLGALSAIFNAGNGTIVPTLVERNSIKDAYALQEGVESLAWIAGPVVAGILISSVGAEIALAVDSLSFLGSALGLALTKIPPRVSPQSKTSLWMEIREGLQFFYGTVDLRTVQLTWNCFGLICFGTVSGLIFVGSQAGTGGAMTASLAVSAYAAGSSIGTVAAGKYSANISSRTIACDVLILAVGALLVSTQSDFAVLAGASLIGVSEGFLLVVYLSLRATITPDRLLGRITATATLLGRAASGLSVAWMGVMLDWRGGSEAFILLALLALMLAGWLYVRTQIFAAAKDST